MDNKKALVFIVLATVLLLVAFVPNPAMAAGPRGPATKYLLMKFYETPEDCFQALVSGDIDMMLWPLTIAQYQAAIQNPDIVLGPVTENGMYEFDFNNNETIATYPGVISPMSQAGFRAALALLTDKWYIIEDIAGGFATRMDVPVVVNAPSWINSSCVYPNYDWEYDSARAAQVLNSWGFVEGTTTNPYYDPGFPGSAQKIRVYPQNATVVNNPKVGTDVTGPPYEWTLRKPALKIVRVMGLKQGDHYYSELAYTFDAENNKVTVAGVTLEEGSFLWIQFQTPHPKAGQDLDPIIFYARSDHSLRMKAAEHLRDNMLKMGIPVDFKAGPSAFCRPPVMTRRDYHIYTGGWRLGRFPTSLFFLYHSAFWYPDGPNYVVPACPDPWYGRAGISIVDPNLDICLRDIYYTTSIPEAIAAAKKAQGIMEKFVINVPLCASKSFFAWRSWVLGICNMMAYGPENTYTFLNAYKATGAPDPNTIKVGWNQPPQAVNILFSQWVYDYAILDRIFEGGQAVNPYDIGTDQAWIVQDWGVSSWVDPDDGYTKTKTTYWLRKDVKWVAPKTGEYLRDFKAKDVVFSIMFMYAFDDAWSWDNVMDVDHINVIDDYCYEIAFIDESYWFQYAANYPYLPSEEWKAQFCTDTVYTESGASYAAGDSLYLGDPVAYVEYVKVGTTTLVPGTDYLVRANQGVGAGGEEYYSFDRIYFLKPVSGDLEIKYWNITGDPHGYFPGSDTEWEPTFQSIGPYFLKDYIKGQYALFEANGLYFMETPPLGEIDWLWWWGDRDSTRPAPDFPEGPRTGRFIIDIIDVVYACVAYGSQGMFEPDPRWAPGADLAPSYTTPYPMYGGLIDIYDVTTVLINYGIEFGWTPLN